MRIASAVTIWLSVPQFSPLPRPLVSCPDPSYELSDRSLVAAVRDGDDDAASRLYERYAKRLFGLVESQMGRWLRSATQSEDIVQSVFRSLFRGVRSGSYDVPQGNTLWHLLAVVAVHKLRKRATRLTAKCRDIRRNVLLESSVEGGAFDPRGLELIEMTLRETLDAMRETDRQILLLRIQGHTVDEISGSVGRSRRTVERSLGNSRRLLADRLLEDDAEANRG
jgi:RNA polymerase sigma-70 factor, ECF subfamily